MLFEGSPYFHHFASTSPSSALVGISEQTLVIILKSFHKEEIFLCTYQASLARDCPSAPARSRAARGHQGRPRSGHQAPPWGQVQPGWDIAPWEGVRRSVVLGAWHTETAPLLTEGMNLPRWDKEQLLGKEHSLSTVIFKPEEAVGSPFLVTTRLQVRLNYK